MSQRKEDDASTSDFQEYCFCGHMFQHLNALSFHRRTCTKSKKRVANALTAAQEVYAQKRRRLNLVGVPEPLENQPGLVAETTVPQSSLAPIPNRVPSPVRY
jgi:hypothetical protein